MMSTESPFSDALIYAAQLPLSWSRRRESESMDLAERNLGLLRCIYLMDEQPASRSDEELELESAIMRVEAKLDIVLELLSIALKKELHTPAEHAIRLTYKGIEWSCIQNPPELDESIWISLHLDPRIPMALQLAARVVSIGSGSGGGQVVVCRFEEMEERVGQLLEKIIFRHHRRQVAMSRS